MRNYQGKIMFSAFVIGRAMAQNDSERKTLFGIF
jgi:hypothetical protein